MNHLAAKPALRSLFVIAYVLFAVCACSSTHDGNPAAVVDSRKLKAVLSQPDTVDYPAVQRFALNINCTSCHNAVDKKDGVDLSTYEATLNGVRGRKFVEPFQPEESSLVEVLNAVGSRHMPPLDKPALTADQKKLIFVWIENGARRVQGEPAPKPALPLSQQLKPYFDHPENIDYDVVRQFVLAQSCLKCHSLDGEKPDKDAIANFANLTNYKTMFSVFTPVVVKGSPAESKLFQSIAMTQSMPPENEGYQLLEGLRIKLMRLWIWNCAIESKKALGDEVLTPDPDHKDEKVRNCNPPATAPPSPPIESPQNPV